jgi:hypothetical protein
MMDIDPAAVEAAGRTFCHDGWDVAAERAVHIGSVRAALAAAYPIIADAVARRTANAIADRIEQDADLYDEEDPVGDAYQHAAVLARLFTTAVTE